MTIHKFKFCIHFLFAFATLFVPLVSYSQTATLSPYSRYGVGDLLFNGFANHRAMGGISIGVQQATQLNFGNPASYAADTIVLFEVGLIGEAFNFSNQNSSTNKTNGNLSYLAMGFPLIKRHLYLSLGMSPFSASGYNIKQESTVSYPGNAKFIYEGSGGYNRFYAGAGIALAKNITAGINASYLFGSSSRISKVEYQDVGYINTLIRNSTTVSDLLVEAGLQYSTVTSKGLQLTFGLAGSPMQNINAKRDLVWVNYAYSSGNAIGKDTVLSTEDEKGNIRLPLKGGIGFTVSKKAKWLIGADFKMTKWKDFESYGINGSLKNSFNINVGGQWLPDVTSTKYFNRAEYRAGFYYNSGYLELKNDRIKDFGVSIGAGFPLRGKPYFSHLNLAIELGEEGTLNDNLVRKRYGRIVLGLTFREDWFRKPKFD